MATPDYSVNYDDRRFTEVEADKQAALSEVEQTYGGMINNSDKYYQAQIDAAQDYADKQTQLQQEQTDFAIEKIEQQKDQAKQDYTKEQSGAYVDWQKQSNQYGANAEQMAAQGMQNTGFSESSQVAMYNTYQNRVMTARETYNRAVLNYDNAIKDAQLQNNSLLAEIAYNALQTQLELSLQGFQYKNQLLIEQSNKKLEVDNTYYQRYQDVLNQINTENALAEEIRQFDTNIAFTEEQNRLDREHETSENQKDRDWKSSEAALDREHETSENQKDRDWKSKEAELERKYNEAQAELERKHELELQAAETKAEKELLKIKHEQELEALDAEYEKKKELLKEETAAEKSLLDYQNSLKNNQATFTKPSGKSGGSSSAGKTNTSKNAGKANIEQVNISDTDKGNTGSKASINMASVLSLGYGPISAARAYELVKNGLAETYTKNGVTYFRKTAYVNKQRQLFQ